MTTQKAIEAITEFREVAYGHAVLAEALDMAIEALSAQPEKECEKCIFKPFKQFQPDRKND